MGEGGTQLVTGGVGQGTAMQPLAATQLTVQIGITAALMMAVNVEDTIL